MHIVSSHLNFKVQSTNVTIKNILDEQSTVVGSTKFGVDSLVFLHLVTKIAPEMPIIWVDTGYNSRETLAFVDEATDKLELNLHVYKPEEHSIQIPPEVGHSDHADFKEAVKLGPFKRALADLGASHWVSSVRAYQTPNRDTLPKILKLPGQLTKVHPMLEWSQRDMDTYRATHGLPLGPESYDPTKGEKQRECGLHEVRSFFN